MLSSQRLSAFNFRSNGIGFLRLLFASVVLWSHSFDIGGFGFDPVVWYSRGAESAGTLAVAGFFVLSGFLITRSYETTGKLERFIWHRFLRIFPGYWVCLIVTALGIAPIMFFHQHATLHGFLSQVPGPFGYIFRNAGLMEGQVSIGYLISSSAEPNSLNGSLWTLPVEFFCYTFVGIAGTFAILARRRFAVLALIVVLQSAAFVLVRRLTPGQDYFAVKALEITVYFLVGSAAYLYRERVLVSAAAAAMCLVASVASLPFSVYVLIGPWCVSYCVMVAAMWARPRSFDRRIDLSYGVYIYAFPVQQLLALYRVPALGFTVYLIASSAIAGGVAFVSWSAIERPCLKLKNAKWPPRGRAREANLLITE